jgi:uncharacterized integral membrane protein (TIGR00698 family)
MELQRQLNKNEGLSHNVNESKKRENFLKTKAFMSGIILTLVLALIAGQIANLPFFSIMGIMIISILLGMSWKSMMGVQQEAVAGINFSSKKLLRVGIILLGLRLNLTQIAEAGISIILIDAIVIAFTLVVMIALGKAFKINKHLSALIAVGTAVCGAAAIVAVAPLIKAKKEYIALSVACIAILGTFGAIGYIFIYPFIDLNDYSYGVLVGATLHELAHVIAAGIPGGETGSETALLVKLGRVALLIPVAIIMEFLFSRNQIKADKKKKSIKELPIPWFIFGFLAMSIINTIGLVPEFLTNILILISVYLLSMAMAGLGLGINFGDFKKVGFKPVLVGILGFFALAAIGPLLLYLI